MKKIFAIICLCCGLSMTAVAQCGIENTAFKSGELLSYDLYFNWKFIPDFRSLKVRMPGSLI